MYSNNTQSEDARPLLPRIYPPDDRLILRQMASWPKWGNGYPLILWSGVIGGAAVYASPKILGLIELASHGDADFLHHGLSMLAWVRIPSVMAITALAVTLVTGLVEFPWRITRNAFRHFIAKREGF